MYVRSELHIQATNMGRNSKMVGLELICHRPKAFQGVFDTRLLESVSFHWSATLLETKGIFNKNIKQLIIQLKRGQHLINCVIIIDVYHAHDNHNLMTRKHFQILTCQSEQRATVEKSSNEPSQCTWDTSNHQVELSPTVVQGSKCGRRCHSRRTGASTSRHRHRHRPHKSTGLPANHHVTKSDEKL